MSTYARPSPHPASGVSPPPSIIPDAVLADLSSPDLSLAQVAARHNVSLSDLSLFLSRPDASEELAALHLLAIEHARYLAALELPHALNTLKAACALPVQERDAVSPTCPNPAPNHNPNLPTPSALDPAIFARRLETARRAASTILQLTRISPPVFQFAHARDRLARHTLSWAPPPPPKRYADRVPTSPAPASTPAPVPPACEPPTPTPTPEPVTATVEPETLDPASAEENLEAETFDPSTWPTLDQPSPESTSESPELVTAGATHEHWP